MTTYAGLFGMGGTEMIVVFGLAVLLFGAARIPQLARSMGKSISEFKKGMSEGVKDGESGEGDAKKAEEKKDEASSEKKN